MCRHSKETHMRYLTALLAGLLVLSPMAAYAGGIDMTQPLAGVNGEPLRDTSAVDDAGPCKAAACPVLTLGRAASLALYASYPDEQSLGADQKWARGALAQKVAASNTAALTVEEIAVIKRCMGKFWSALIISEAFPLLDPNAAPPKVQ